MRGKRAREFRKLANGDRKLYRLFKKQYKTKKYSIIKEK